MTKFNEGRSHLMMSTASPGTGVQSDTTREIAVPIMGTQGINNTLSLLCWVEVQGTNTTAQIRIEGKPSGFDDDVQAANWRALGDGVQIPSGDVDLFRIERAFTYRVNVLQNSGTGLVNVWIFT